VGTHIDGKQKVLVVDDDSDTVESTALVLELLGHQVQTALGGEQAITRARSFRPDLLFLDIRMPGMDGYQVARALHRMPGVVRPVLIAMSGLSSAEEKRRCAEAGFDIHLTKPVDPEVFERLSSLLTAARRGGSPGDEQKR
jgi:CheY-like chemotaxis protein